MDQTTISKLWSMFSDAISSKSAGVLSTNTVEIPMPLLYQRQKRADDADGMSKKSAQAKVRAADKAAQQAVLRAAKFAHSAGISYTPPAGVQVILRDSDSKAKETTESVEERLAALQAELTELDSEEKALERRGREIAKQQKKERDAAESELAAAQRVAEAAKKAAQAAVDERRREEEAQTAKRKAEEKKAQDALRRQQQEAEEAAQQSKAGRHSARGRGAGGGRRGRGRGGGRASGASRPSLSTAGDEDTEDDDDEAFLLAGGASFRKAFPTAPRSNRAASGASGGSDLASPGRSHLLPPPLDPTPSSNVPSRHNRKPTPLKKTKSGLLSAIVDTPSSSKATPSNPSHKSAHPLLSAKHSPLLASLAPTSLPPKRSPSGPTTTGRMPPRAPVTQSSSNPFVPPPSRRPPSDQLLLTVEDFGPGLTGVSLQLYWPDDGTWWEAVVQSVDVAKREVVVRYATGEDEATDLIDLIEKGEVAWTVNPPGLGGGGRRASSQSKGAGGGKGDKQGGGAGRGNRPAAGTGGAGGAQQKKRKPPTLAVAEGAPPLKKSKQMSPAGSGALLSAPSAFGAGHRGLSRQSSFTAGAASASASSRLPVHTGQTKKQQRSGAGVAGGAGAAKGGKPQRITLKKLLKMGRELVGRSIEVFWEQEGVWKHAVVTSASANTVNLKYDNHSTDSLEEEEDDDVRIQLLPA